MDIKHNIGVVSVSFRKHTPEEILKAMKASGLSFIEWGSDVHAPYNDTERLTALSKMQNEYGISCSSYGTYFKLGITPIEELPKYIDAAKILGTRILRLWCGNKSGANMSDQEKSDLIEQCKQAAQIAEKMDAVLCMECHRNTLTERLCDTLELMEAVASPNFRMYWQPFQWLEPHDNVELAKAISPYTEHIHVFNWRDTERLPLRDGIEAWREYMKQFDAPRVLLLEFMPDDLIETLPAEAEALKIIANLT